MNEEQLEEQREAELAAALPVRMCVICGQQINPLRLLHFRETEICVGCSKTHGPEFELVASEIILRNREGSFKSTTGGVNVEFRRRTLPRS